MSRTPPGDQLAQARADAGMSIDDVAGATKLRASMVAAIEAGDFSACGGDVYARGHLRTIAQVVGLDPDAVAAAFDASLGADDQPRD